ncbi:unnamed protein product, partial [Mesorhabditis belari]|uniref:Uncharacterized protein n=1 Tax=Mesorhabditis belari TaxID=2138241 RepID=A0AAF3FRK6_9BILA
MEKRLSCFCFDPMKTVDIRRNRKWTRRDSANPLNFQVLMGRRRSLDDTLHDLMSRVHSRSIEILNAFSKGGNSWGTPINEARQQQMKEQREMGMFQQNWSHYGDFIGENGRRDGKGKKGKMKTEGQNVASVSPSPRPPPFPQQVDVMNESMTNNNNNSNGIVHHHATSNHNNVNNNNSTVSQSDSRLSFASSSTGYSSARSSLRSTEGTDEDHHDLLFSPASSMSEVRRRALQSNGGLNRLQMIASELIETERTYVNDLWQVIQGYLNYLVDTRDSLDLTVDEVSHTFGCIEKIFQLNRRLYVRLDEAELDCLRISKCFIDFAGSFDDYVTYCTNYQKMLSTLSSISTRPIVTEALQRRQQQLGHSLPLSSYLLKPVQRILKYHLFIEHILKELTAIGVPNEELKVVKKALEVMTTQASRINEEKKRVEHQERVHQLHAQIGRWKSNEPTSDLAAYGELLLEASFRVSGSKATRLLFLFEEMLLIVKQKGTQYVCKDYIMCSNLMLNEVVSEDPLAFQVLSFDNPRSQYIFAANSTDQKRQWMQELKRMVLDHYEVAIPEETKRLMLSMDHTQPKVTFGRPEFAEVSAKNHRKFPKYLEKRRKSVERKEKEERQREESPANANRRRRSLSASRLMIETLPPCPTDRIAGKVEGCTCPHQASTSSARLSSEPVTPRQRLFETKKSRHHGSTIGLPRHDRQAVKSLPDSVIDSCCDEQLCTCSKKPRPLGFRECSPSNTSSADIEATFADLYKSLTMLGVENVSEEKKRKNDTNGRNDWSDSHQFSPLHPPIIPVVRHRRVCLTATPCDTAAATRRLDDLVKKYSHHEATEPAVKMRSKSLTRLDQLVRTMGSDDEDTSRSGTLRANSPKAMTHQGYLERAISPQLSRCHSPPSRPQLIRPSTAVDPRLLSPDAGPLERWQLKRLMQMGPAPPIPDRKTPSLELRRNGRLISSTTSARQRTPLTVEQIRQMGGTTQMIDEPPFLMGDSQLGVVREMVRQLEGQH